MFDDDYITENYFSWLIGFVDGHGEHKAYYMLLKRLFDTNYIYQHPMDENRAWDGLSLRNDYTMAFGEEFNSKPCSVLEMMVALALRCERDIMHVETYGDRTAKWFWLMIDNLGLGTQIDNKFNSYYVDACIFNFLNRMYEDNGEGGLFYTPGSTDMTRHDIWYQMNHYLTYLIERGEC